MSNSRPCASGWPLWAPRYDERMPFDADRLLRLVATGNTAALSPEEVPLAKEVAVRLGFTKDAQTVTPGNMAIVWCPPPDIASALAVKGGVDPDDLHVTLAHCPQPADPNVVLAAAVLASQLLWECDGTINGSGRFVIDDDTDAVFVSVDSPGLSQLRDVVLGVLAQGGVQVSKDHGFVPHITLAYLPRSQASPNGGLARAIPVTIDSLSVIGPAPAGVAATIPLNKISTDDDAVAKAARNGLLPPPGTPQRAKAMSTMEKGVAPCPGCGGPTANGSCACCGNAGPDCSCGEAGHTHPDADAASITKDAALPEGVGLEYTITKATTLLKANGAGEYQYTLGPVYAPMQLDAHDEYITDDVLHKAMMEYSLSGDRNLRFQHNTSVVSGTWVELMRLPAEMTAPVTKADGTSTDVTFPKGTVMMGVIWSDEAWPLVKAGKIGGLSMGGRAVRVRGKGQTADVDKANGPGLPAMGYQAVSNPGSAPNQGRVVP